MEYKLRRQLADYDSFSPDQVIPQLQRVMDDYEQGLNGMINDGNAAAMDLLEAETRWADTLEKSWSPASHLNSVTDSEALREVYNEAIQMLTRHSSWRQQHGGLFRVYREWAESGAFPGLAQDLRRLIELEIRDFELAGVGLGEDKQAEYREIMLRISKLSTRFSENVLDATQAWSRHFDDVTALDGLPAQELHMLAGLAGEEPPEGIDGWLVNLSHPSFQAIMMHATDRALRKEVYYANATRASEIGPHAGRWDNTNVISEILDQRHALAQILGFPNYVDYALSRRMAQSSHGVLKFLQEIGEIAVPRARAQLQELQAFATAQGAELPLRAWDVSFWSERFRQQELQLSDEELKPYFPLRRMMAAVKFTVGELFGITLQGDPEVTVWHKDVRFYWIYDSDQKVIAGIYLDLFSRRNKRGGAWMDVSQSRCQTPEGTRLPVAFLTCNFSPPTGEQPSLLTHADVETLFHEFGHCLHHLLTRIDWPQINGIHGVEWDAVELPSQLMENWCWEDSLLNRFARHYKTDEPIPEVLLGRLQRSRRFHKALFLVRQLEYAVLDLRLHLEYDPASPRDPLQIIDEVRKQFAVVEVPQWNRFLNSFGHIFGGGYAAGYYSYLWAEQLAADAWQRFAQEGAFNRQLGSALEQEILAVGASRPAIASFQAFRGRLPEIGPLLESYGL